MRPFLLCFAAWMMLCVAVLVSLYKDTLAHDSAASAAVDGLCSADSPAGSADCGQQQPAITAAVPFSQQLAQPPAEEVSALLAEVERLTKENESLRQRLTAASTEPQRSQSTATQTAHMQGSSTYPWPKGKCMHPPHYSLAPRGVRALSGPLPTNRSAHRFLTDPHGLTLNLEFVTRGQAPPKGYVGDLAGVAELTSLPSAVEFARDYTLLSRPFVVRGTVSDWPSFSRWSDDYLASKFPRTEVQVRRDKHGDKVFHYNRESLMETMAFADFLLASQSEEERAKYLERQALLDEAYTAKTGKPAVAKSYPPLNNDRLYLAQAPLVWKGVKTPLYPLCDDLGENCPQPPFSAVLNVKHQNLWMGRGNKTVTAHYDSNEGVMALMSGWKTFTLWSPSNRNYLYPSVANEFSAVSSQIPDAQMSGAEPLEQRFACFKHARPITVTLGPGDLFYLPAYWWHRVESRGRSLGINWWFSAHSLLLQQIMKTIDLNVDVTERNGTVRPQIRW